MFEMRNLWGIFFGITAFGGFAGSASIAGSVLPLILSFIGIGFVAKLQSNLGKDDTQTTFYGRYGATTAASTLWVFGYTACIVVSVLSFVTHFPGFGEHYLVGGRSSPLYSYIVRGECIDVKDADLCSANLCMMTEIGDREFNTRFCADHPSKCLGGGTAYDWAIANCWGTCNCKGPFNPVEQCAEKNDFACERTGTCAIRQNQHNVFWVFIKWPTVIETHVVTGIVMMLLGPLQFLSKVRQWRSYEFHRYNGRFMLLLLVPNQLSALWLSIAGLSTHLGPHAYTKVYRIGLFFLVAFTIIFASAGWYHIRRKNFRLHGEFMIRLMACWFSIPFFRMLMPISRVFVGPFWMYSLCSFSCYSFPLIAAEIYIRRSGRFTSSSFPGIALDSEGTTSRADSVQYAIQPVTGNCQPTNKIGVTHDRELGEL